LNWGGAEEANLAGERWWTRQRRNEEDGRGGRCREIRARERHLDVQLVLSGWSAKLLRSRALWSGGGRVVEIGTSPEASAWQKFPRALFTSDSSFSHPIFSRFCKRTRWASFSNIFKWSV